MEKEIAFCKQMDLSVLPQQMEDFSLVVDHKELDSQFLWFHYENDKNWKWQILYDEDVEDFTAVVELPLSYFNSLSLIKPTGETFWANFLEHFEKEFASTFTHQEEYLSFEYRKNGIHKWDYENVLPEVIGPYHLDIRPNKGVKTINGSYYIASYVHESKQSGLTLSFNVMRNDFYAEFHRDGKAIITHELDANSLASFEKVLKRHLVPMLESFEP